MDVKAVATDIDATLTDKDRKLCISVLKALRKVEEKGIPVILATGNVLPVALAFSIYGGFSGPIVAENGGIVFDKRTQRFEKICDIKDVKEAIRLLDSSQIKYRMLLTNRWRETEIGIEEDVDINELKEVLKECNVNVFSTKYGIHIQPKGVDKFEGIKVACRWLGVDVKEVVAIGDSDGDSSMLRNCGIGIAVANATERAKKSADWVTEGKFGDGVVEALIKLGILNGDEL